MKILSRLVPYITVIGALAAVLIGNFGLITLSVADQVIIGLLALVAADALVERMTILQRIEGFIFDSKATSGLRPRAEIPRPDVLASSAATIDIWAVSAVSIIAQHRGFYRDRLDLGCRIRVILLDPESDAVAIHARQSHADAVLIRSHIHSTIAALAPLLNPTAPHTGLVELRLSSVFAPFSLVAADLEKPSGTIVAEFHTYRTDLDTRAHVVLESHNQARWFRFFRSQFEAAWSDSKQVSGDLVSASVGLVESSMRPGL